MQISEGISDFYKRYQGRIRDIGIVIIGVLLLGNAFGVVDEILPKEIANSIVIAIILFIIRDISTSLPKTDSHIYGDQSIVYQELLNKHRNKHNGDVVFYHYSGTMIHDLIIMLYANGYSIRLFINNSEYAEKYGSKHQANRINAMLMELKDEIKKQKRGGKISIYMTNAPVSVRAARFDNKYIALGWYVYEWRKEPLSEFPDDKIRVWGHDSFGVLISDQHPEFKSANKFLESYEQKLAASEVWSFPDVN